MEDDLARDVHANRLSSYAPKKDEIIHFIDDHDRPPSTPRRKEHWKTEARAIGKGGQGHVFLQICIGGSRFHTQRAVKKIRLEQDDGGKKRYMRELRAITRFSHPKYARHFVQSLGWYETKRSLWITMEYLDDGDLHTYLQSCADPMAEDDSRHIIRQVLQSLAIMHHEKFSHGDIKPKNILIRQRAVEGQPHTWWVKLADFGISKRAKEASGKTTVVGTHEYMAPEMYRGTMPTDYPPAADIWAVGVMTFHMLTKDNAFQSNQLIGQYPDRPEELFPRAALDERSISAQGQAFIRKMMGAIPDQRPSSRQALDDGWIQVKTKQIQSRQTEPSYESDSSDSFSIISNTSVRSDEISLTTQSSVNTWWAVMASMRVNLWQIYAPASAALAEPIRPSADTSREASPPTYKNRSASQLSQLSPSHEGNARSNHRPPDSHSEVAKDSAEPIRKTRAVVPPNIPDGQRQIGLHQVYPDPGNRSKVTNMDIIAIHGLDTQSPKVWVAWANEDPSSRHVHWLRDEDMLPSRFPDARILTYDWNANFDREAVQAGLLHHADQFLDRVDMERSTLNRTEPILFVAHDIGGLLLAKALLRAAGAHSSHKSIHESTIGIAFLGTPFYGCSGAFYMYLQARLAIAESEQRETCDELVKYLDSSRDNTLHLNELLQQFIEMIGRQEVGGHSIKIKCFYETRKTSLGLALDKILLTTTVSGIPFDKIERNTVVVPEHSACLPGHGRVGLDVRHLFLNKFSGPHDTAFQVLVYHLRELTQDVHDKQAFVMT